MRRAIFVILDGLGDLPGKEGKTPLQTAHKPLMDRLAREGATGLFHPLGRGIIPGSDTAHLEIFGFPPEKYYPGRGPLEALGEELQLKEGDVAFRGNFATVDERGFVIDRRAGRIRDEGRILAREFNDMNIEGVDIIVRSSVEHRVALIFRGQGLSHEISDTDPHSDRRVRYLVSKPNIDTKEARFTAEVLNRFTERSYEILKNHPINIDRKRSGRLPANIILVRGAGKFFKPPTFYSLYGVKAAFVGGGALYKGVARFVGIHTETVEGATGRGDTNLQNKMDVALDLLKRFRIVFIHIKGTDSFGHDGDFYGKVRMIEDIDRALNYLYTRLPFDTYIILTGDHTTSCVRKRHSSEPVPLIINGPDIPQDTVAYFDEVSCSIGYLGNITGKELFHYLLDLLGKGEMFGA